MSQTCNQHVAGWYTDPWREGTTLSAPLMLMETVQPPQAVCRDCRWSECEFRVPRVRAYLIAYREAVKCGDDPAEYIRDSIKPSRRVGEDEGKQDTDALIPGTKQIDTLWYVDVKLSLEAARAAGLSLDAWNAEKVAVWLCARASELPVDP